MAGTAETEKVIVFTVWTDMLDLIEGMLDMEGLPCSRLDGTMDSAAREAAVSEFETNPDIRIFLVPHLPLPMPPDPRQGTAAAPLSAFPWAFLFCEARL